MKNKYEIRGDATVIFCKYKGIEYESIIDTEDFPIAQKLRGTWALAPTKTKKSFYVQANVWDWPNRKQNKKALHREIMRNPKNLVVDHINHDTLNNRKANLRAISQQENSQNTDGATKNNRTSGVRGVSWNKQIKKWVALVQSKMVQNGVKKKYYVGQYDDLEEAKIDVEKARAQLLKGSLEALEMNVTDFIKVRTSPDQARRDSTSGVRNVIWYENEKRWCVEFKRKGVKVYRKKYDSFEEACEVAEAIREKLRLESANR